MARKKEVTIYETISPWSIRRTYVTPGERIEIHEHKSTGILTSVRIFVIGDECEHGSYNLTYTGKIEGITAKNVMVDTGGGTKRLRIAEFAMRNHDFDLEDIQRRNNEISMSI